MSVLVAPESEYAKERVKFEAQYSECGPPGRPYVYREYPTRMYKAGRPDNGLGAHVIAEEVTAGSENEALRYEVQGFRKNPLDAIKLLDDQQKEFGRLAAELNHEQKTKLSPMASAEVDAARDAHSADISGHMPAVPVTPIKSKRGRKAKTQES